MHTFFRTQYTMSRSRRAGRRQPPDLRGITPDPAFDSSQLAAVSYYLVLKLQPGNPPCGTGNSPPLIRPVATISPRGGRWKEVAVVPMDRPGFSVIELMIAVLLLGTVFAMLGPTLTWIRQQRRLADDRQLALIELSNVAERLSLVSYEAVTPEHLAGLTLAPPVAAALPQARLSATLADETEPPAKRVTLELTWKGDGTRPVAPLRLVTWRYPPAGDAPMTATRLSIRTGTRRGTSLVELLFVMSVMAAILSTATLTLVRLLQAQSAGTVALAESLSVSRLAHDLRRDAHAATAATLSAEGKGRVLTFTGGDSGDVTYTGDGAALRRRGTTAEGVVTVEDYRLGNVAVELDLTESDRLASVRLRAKARHQATDNGRAESLQRRRAGTNRHRGRDPRGVAVSDQHSTVSKHHVQHLMTDT